MKRFFYLSIFLLSLAAKLVAQETFSGYTVAQEGAWCWFADPRATHYENEAGTINMSYVGYIDVHGNVKATQYNFLTGEKNDVLVRSYFQPDDHNNPTFLVLPDERVLIIYSRHTDEPAFYYRISRKPGDITDLGEEKCLKTKNNTTYPSPFLMSDDPTHWYLCWRGIGWHPTMGRLTLPDENDDVRFDWGPYQMVQSTGARPYAKYYSNGRDKLYVTYTTGHPDNEQPNWVYFNVININKGGEPTLEDIKGNKLSTIKNGTFAVNKTADYKSKYPNTVVDAPSNLRDWVWQIALDKQDRPCIAMVKINGGKSQHEYYYAKWTGSAWRLTDLADGGGKFHPSNTEYCYSGGEALDPQNPNIIYLSIPTVGQYGKVHEIWKYTLDDNGKITAKDQITRNSQKNNVRPFVLPGSQGSPLRLSWMYGDYQYWLVKQGYPLGYPTSIVCDYNWTAPTVPAKPNAAAWSYNKLITMDPANYKGELVKVSDEITYSLDAQTHRPYVSIKGKRYDSQCQLYTSDNWAINSTGTSGDNWPTQLGTWYLSMVYDGQRLVVYRNGLIDQIITPEITLQTGNAEKGVAWTQQEVQKQMEMDALMQLTLPDEVHTDLVLPTKTGGENITWTSSNPDIIAPNGVVSLPRKQTEVKLMASTTNCGREFVLNVMPRDITQNLRASFAFDGNDKGIQLKGSAKLKNGKLDLTANTAAGFQTNGYALIDEGLLRDMRSYTVVLTVQAGSLSKSPRLYDFGAGSGNSIFLRANALSAGIKLNNGTTTMVNGTTTLQTGKEYKLAVTFDAATRMTTIYVNGVVDASGTSNQNEPYMIWQSAGDARNYLGRTQWWDGAYAADNVDFVGTMDDVIIYDIALTQKEVCQIQGLPFEEKEYAHELQNGDFEAAYSVMGGSGVTGDRAIYVPEGWTMDYSTRNENDFCALKSGDLYYDQFFAVKPQPAEGGKQTLWVRQRWGSSVLDCYQELQLPLGKYVLSVDVFSSDASDKSYAYVNKVQQHAGKTNAWEKLNFNIESDGEEVIRIGFATTHTDSDAERICAFDNFRLQPIIEDAILRIEDQSEKQRTYDLQGRSTNGKIPGILIRGGRKFIK